MKAILKRAELKNGGEITLQRTNDNDYLIIARTKKGRLSYSNWFHIGRQEKCFNDALKCYEQKINE